jgi:hypothetical protein
MPDARAGDGQRLPSGSALVGALLRFLSASAGSVALLRWSRQAHERVGAGLMGTLLCGRPAALAKRAPRWPPAVVSGPRKRSRRASGPCSSAPRTRASSGNPLARTVSTAVRVPPGATTAILLGFLLPTSPHPRRFLLVTTDRSLEPGGDGSTRGGCRWNRPSPCGVPRGDWAAGPVDASGPAPRGRMRLCPERARLSGLRRSLALIVLISEPRHACAPSWTPRSHRSVRRPSPPPI